MTNSQYIEVAEKVWGLERHYHQVVKKHYFTVDSYIIYDDQLHKEVNSWQGFGRTVEAMHKRDQAKDILEDILDRWGFDDFLTTEQLIEATHLTALEALR